MNWFKHAKTVLNSTFGFSFTDETTEAEFVDQLEAQAKKRNEASESRMSEIDSKIDNLNAALIELGEEMGDVMSSVGSLKDKVELIEGSQNEIVSIREDVNSINGRIDEIAKEKAGNSIKAVKTANGQVAEKGETQKAIEDAKAEGKIEVVFKKPVK